MSKRQRAIRLGLGLVATTAVAIVAVLVPRIYYGDVEFAGGMIVGGIVWPVITDIGQLLARGVPAPDDGRA